MSSYLNPIVKARLLCEFIQVKLAEFEALTEGTPPPATASTLTTAAAPPLATTSTAAGASGIPASMGNPQFSSTPITAEVEVSKVDWSISGTSAFKASTGDGEWSADESWDSMDGSNVDKMLDNRVKPATASKYARIWDKWVTFATFHEVKVMSPEVRALEIFIVNTSELSGSAVVATTAAAAVAHFCAREGIVSPFGCLRFGKILRGIKNTHGKAARPRKPFSRDPILKFILLARRGSLKEWRAALPLALCFQQLLGGGRVLRHHWSNVERMPGFFRVEVKMSKNHPEGFNFRVPVNEACPNCVGVFLSDYITVMGIKLGNEKSLFACKISGLVSGRDKGIKIGSHVKVGRFENALVLQRPHQGRGVGPDGICHAFQQEGWRDRDDEGRPL
jgi:hypothetical protein